MISRNRTGSAAVALAGITLAGLTAAPAWGLSSDSRQPIHLAADRADMYRKTGISVYSGDVQVTRGTMRMTGDKLTVYTDKDGQVQKMVAVGKPATYRQLPDNKKQYLKGEGQTIEYYAGQDRVVLLHQARVWQGGNIFRSNRIVYSISKDVVNAGAAGGKDRVHITIPPKTTDSH
ncbi:MAG: lipopolysaccharide transport periplasmic protein LptA [Gammaproteobacteria bacterium]